MEDVLGWRLDVLGLRIMEPERPGRVVAVGMEPRWLAAAGCAGGGILSASVAGLKAGLPLGSRMLPSPVGEGNWVNLKSVEADSMLACRSSKLTEGRKSYEPEDCRPASPFRLNEKCDWPDEEALSIGAFDTGLVPAVVEEAGARLEVLWGLERGGRRSLLASGRRYQDERQAAFTGVQSGVRGFRWSGPSCVASSQGHRADGEAMQEIPRGGIKQGVGGAAGLLLTGRQRLGASVRSGS